MIIFVIVILIICLFVVYIFTRSKTKTHYEKRYKLIRYSGLFRQVSGLNIGHPKEAPIFHARPWFGRDLHHGLGEYVGGIKLPPGKMISLTFPETDFAYEVNIMKYPQWENILEENTLYKPKNISIGYRGTDVIIEENIEFIIMVTGITGSNTHLRDEDVDVWLNKCNILILEEPSSDVAAATMPAIYKKNKPPTQEDAS